MQNLSTLLSSIPPSATIAVNDKAKALKAAGRDIISLAGGDPNFDTPHHITAAAFAAIESGNTHYPAPSKGTKPAIEAIAAKFERDTDRTIDPAAQVIVTPGGKWALNLTLNALLNPGDEVLYLEPVWVSYPPMIRLAGGVPVAVSLPSATNFTITADLLREKVTSKTKALMVNSPSNPTGRVLTQAEVDAIVEVANEADLYVIFDELYEQLIFDGRHIPLTTMPGMWERTITVNGLSKAYAMTGWRLGWMIAPPPVVKLAAKLHSQTVTSAASFGMTAIAAALNGPQDEVEAMRLAYKARRDFMVPALNAIEGIECASIEGAFYLFPRFTKTALDSLEIASALLEHTGVAGTPGIAFGASGEGHLRFSIATAMSDLEEAVTRLARVVPTL
jgi:aspartate aminotransferase